MLTILRFAVETRSETNILPPGFTSYKSQLQYQVYDVTEMLSGEFPSGFHADRGRIRRMGGRFLCLHASQPVVIK